MFFPLRLSPPQFFGIKDEKLYNGIKISEVFVKWRRREERKVSKWNWFNVSLDWEGKLYTSKENKEKSQPKTKIYFKLLHS